MRFFSSKKISSRIKKNILPAIIFIISAVVFYYQPLFAASSSTASTVLGFGINSQMAPILFFMGLLVAILSVLTWSIGQLLVLIIGVFLVPVLGYNNFADSYVVSLGWPLVRDVTNMFVIIVLLVIAIKTIINSSSANWEQQLPRLFIAVLLINFSKTITLLIIDAGQVVMFTFVNALQDIAAGNFVSMFQINEIMQMKNDLWDTVTDPTLGAQLFGLLGTSYANLILLSIILVVMVVLTIIFIYRIVLLWILIILSPLAFLMHGVKDVLPKAGAQASKWWDKLIAAVTLGPILTFFLWLALATASMGAIANTEGMSTEGTTDSASSMFSEVFHVDQMLSLMIGIILIMVGFQAASGAAASMGGIASTFVNEKQGRALAKNVAKFPAAISYKAGRGVGRRAINTKLGREIVGDASTALGKLGTSIARSKVPGSSWLGGKIIVGSQTMKDGLTDYQIKNRQEARQGLGKLSDEVFGQHLYAMLQGRPVTNKDVAKREEALAMMTEDAGKAAAFKKQLEEQYGKKEGEARFAQIMKDAFAEREKSKSVLSKDEQERFERSKEKNLRFLSDEQKEKVLQKMADEGRIRNITAEDLKDSVVQAFLDRPGLGKSVRNADGSTRERTLRQELLESGGLSPEKRKALRAAAFARYDDNKQPVGSAEQIDASVLKEALAGQALNIENLTVEDIKANGVNIAKAGVDAGVDFSKITDSAARKEIGQILLDQSIDSSVPEAQRRKYAEQLFNIPEYKVENLSANDIASRGADLVEAGAVAGVDFSRVQDSNVRAAVAQQLHNAMNSQGIPEIKRRQYAKEYFVVEPDNQKAVQETIHVNLKGGFTGGAEQQSKGRRVLREIIVKAPDKMFKFKDHVKNASGNSELVQEIADNISSQVISNLEKQSQALDHISDPAERAALAKDLKSSIAVMMDALDKRTKSMKSSKFNQERKVLQNRLRELKKMSRYI